MPLPVAAPLERSAVGCGRLKQVSGLVAFGLSAHVLAPSHFPRNVREVFRLTLVGDAKVVAA